MEALRSGRGRLFGSGAAAASVAPEPDRAESDARVDEGNRAGYRLSDPVPERRRGADDGDDDAGAVGRRRKRFAAARRGTADEKLERAREDTREDPSGSNAACVGALGAVLL
jgi:hypothetical protein